MTRPLGLWRDGPIDREAALSAIGRCFVSSLALAAGIALAASSAPAQDDGVWATLVIGIDEPVCEPPISTCEFGPTLDANAPVSWPFPPDNCPLGHACVCVPSCPECDDCAAQVCVPEPGRECRTACDCPTGLGCFDGQCIAGFAPVYCCEADICPAGQQCQHRNGAMDRCEPVDPTCRERVEKIANAVNHLLERGSRCHVDSDCVRINFSTECGIPTCGTFFVNRRRAPYIERRIRLLDHRICSTYREDGCQLLAGICPPRTGACIENRCVTIVDTPVPLPLESAPSP